MDIVIDLTPIIDFFSLPFYLMFWRMFLLFGWMPVVLVFLWGAREVWLMYVRGQWGAENAKFLLLAVDIPRGNEQSPKAVENIFTYLAGAHASHNLLDEYWEGRYQLPFSFEIVSIEGYTQFLIHTPIKFRDLVESAVYSQYPDAEITEVNDYTDNAPATFPDDEYDIWGTEFIQVNKSVYPIKTYKEFEVSLGMGGVQYKDPMATLMDLSSSLKKDEQLWYQIIVKPIGFEWAEEGEKEIGRILGEDVDSKVTFLNKLADTTLDALSYISEMIYKLWGDIEDQDSSSESKAMSMMELRPKQKKQVEGIQNKVSKIGFEFTLRVVYVAKKEVMNKAKVANGFVGYMKQFADVDTNNLKPDMDITATSADYFFVESRLKTKKNNIIRNYRNRSVWGGRLPGILDVEELASLWHFPIESAVKAPLIQKAMGKKAEPPMHLPISENIVGEEISEPIFKQDDIDNINEKINKKDVKKENDIFEIEEEDGDEQEENSHAAPPSNLPFA